GGRRGKPDCSREQGKNRSPEAEAQPPGCTRCQGHLLSVRLLTTPARYGRVWCGRATPDHVVCCYPLPSAGQPGRTPALVAILRTSGLRPVRSRRPAHSTSEDTRGLSI